MNPQEEARKVIFLNGTTGSRGGAAVPVVSKKGICTLTNNDSSRTRAEKPEKGCAELVSGKNGVQESV